MLTPYLIFDLDGPILDVSDRYYALYVFLMQEGGYEPVSKADYWQAKREKTPEGQILAKSGAAAYLSQYQKKRMELIETGPWLQMDRVHEGIAQMLSDLSAHNRLILVTLRRNRDLLLQQLRSLEIDQYFADILCNGEEREPRWQIKVDLIHGRAGLNARAPEVFVGDTETDMLAGNELKCATLGVLSGIRSRERLNAAHAHCIADSALYLRTWKPELFRDAEQ